MRFQGVGYGWRPARLMFTVLLQMMLLAAAAHADGATAGTVTNSGCDGAGVRVAFASVDGQVILQENTVAGSTDLWMPTGTSLTLTVTCIPSVLPEIQGVVITDIDGNQRFFDNSGKKSVSWNTGPLTLNQHDGQTQKFNVTVAFKGAGTSADSCGVACRFNIYRPKLQVITQRPEDNEEYLGRTWNQDWYLDVLTTNKDVFNLNYNIHLEQPSPKGNDTYDPSPGVDVRVGYYQEPVKTTGWGTTDKKGDVLVAMGAGDGPTVAVTARILAPALYLLVEALDKEGKFPSKGYIPKTCVLPQFAKLAGWLEVLARDMDDHPLRANLKAWGGPVANGCIYGTTNELGFKELEINPNNVATGLETKRYTAKVAPLVRLEGIYTQLIDGPGGLVEGVPFYFSPRYSLHPDAYTYPITDTKPSYCSGGRIELLDGDSESLLEEESIEISLPQPTQLDVSKRRDRTFMPRQVTRDQKWYKMRVVFDDTDGTSEDGKVNANAEPMGKFSIQATREERKPAYTVAFVACSVGAWSRGNIAYRMREVPELSMLQQASFSEMFPGTLIFSSGGVLEPSFWPWENGPAAMNSLARQLQERQRASGVDKVIGLVPPGWLNSIFKGNAAGLQIEGINGAVMIDLSGVSSASSLHEFLHTEGFLDFYDGNYLGPPDNPPPSASGYSTGERREIINLLGCTTKTPRVMYGMTSPSNWLSKDEHSLLMNLIYKSPADSFKTVSQATTPKVAPGPRLRLHGSFYKGNNKSVALLDPVFADVGEPYNPYPSIMQTGNDYCVELMGEDWTRLGIYYIPAKAPLIRVSPGVGQTTRAVEIPMDSQISALFDFSIPADSRIKAVNLGSAGGGTWKTFYVTASAPALQWLSPPAGTLSQPTSIEWIATDADSGDMSLSHEFYVSSDGGATWKQAANRIPWRSTGTGQHPYFYRFTPADWPSGSHYRFKVVSSDGLRNSELVTSQDVTVVGYNPNPEAELLIENWEARRPETGRFTVLVPLRNNGREMLEIAPDPATLPAWLAPAQGGPVKIYPLCDGVLMLAGEQNATGTFTKTITLSTNDPAAPKLTLPVTLIQEGPATAPKIALIALNPDYPDVRPWQPGEKVGISLWDNNSRPTLQAFLTIARTSPDTAELVKDLPMEPGSLPGEHLAEWTIPADAVDGQYSLEFTLHDPANELDDTDDSRTITVQRFTSDPGEAETLPTVLQALYNSFSTADTDHGGGLSLAEAQVQAPKVDINTFNTLDANHDGQLTAKELLHQVNPNEWLRTVLQALLDSFAGADTDRSGALSLAEAQTEAPELDGDTFYMLDANHDALLTAAELEQSLHPSEGEGGGEGEGEDGLLHTVANSLNAVFSMADTDHSGGLSLAEGQARVPSLDADMFNTLDANHDGQLTQAELQPYLNPDEGEGEGEGEGEDEPVPTIARTLSDNFAAADTDQSGGLSLAEAQSQIPGLDAGTFNTLDANHDSQLTLAELEQYLGASPSGCNCSSTKGAFDLKRRLGDLLLAGVSLMVLLMISRKFR